MARKMANNRGELGARRDAEIDAVKLAFAVLSCLVCY